MSLESEFVTQNPEYKHILAYVRDSLGLEVVDWEHLTKVNLNIVATYIKSKVSPNSAATYIGILKGFLNRYSEEGVIPCKSYSKELIARRVPSQHIALTMDEIIRFDEYTPKTQTEKDVKILFMRGCLTGMRLSDALLLTEDNIIGDTLTYVSQKTKVEVRQPVHARLVKYVKVQPKKSHDRKVINQVIRNICKRLGMDEEVQLFVNGRLCKGPKYKFISQHSSRRSYVTCLATNGVPIAVISKLAGHSSVSMTDRYVCIDTSKPGIKAMEFFSR